MSTAPQATGPGATASPGEIGPDAPRYRMTLLRAGRLLLDGGGMFGVIPRVVWSRTVAPDERNRIELAHNCLLLDPVEPGVALEGRRARLGPARTTLLEAGTGDKLDPKMSEIFGLDGRTAESELVRVGRDPSEVRAAVVSHLHFDHAGGLTRRPRGDEPAEWTAEKPGSASGDDPRVRFTFPEAQLIVQRREWVDARANDAVMTRTYFRDHILPFEDRSLETLADGRPRLVLVDSERPFPLNRKPGREEMPRTGVDERMTEVLPGVWVFLVPGHTWGQQAVLFHDASGRAIVFTPDVMPTAWHAGAAYSLSYDVEPFTSMVTKRWLLAEAASRGWVLMLDHEPGHPFVRVRATESGWYELERAMDVGEG